MKSNEQKNLLCFCYNKIYNISHLEQDVSKGEILIPFSDEELEPAVKDVIEKVRPSIKLDGGDIELVAIKEGVVYVQLQGACVGCGSAGTTIKFGVERQLKTLIHPEITVMSVPQGWEDKLDQLG